jgi:hypothetical protein
MPPNNTANIKQWLENSNVDYLTYFMKAWIPFNAWYRHYYALEKEREILNEIKTDNNKIRSRFIARLEGDAPDSIEIRSHIATLHRRLSADPLKDSKQQHISFEKVRIGRNPQNFAQNKSGQWIYRVERVAASKNVVSTITSSRGNVHQTITQPGDWNIEEFLLHPDYVSLTPHDKNILRQSYEAANPVSFASLLSATPPPNALVIDGYNFVKDKDAIFAGLIEILYSMRNMLFHGELVPDPQTKRTYEPAYHLLRHLIAMIV